jgi:sugar lactone lactonase YvrE
MIDNRLCRTTVITSLSRLIATCCFALSCLCSTGSSQAPAPPTPNGTRPASAVYPLDAAADSEGSVWIVDRNRPGVWRYQQDKLELVISGEKQFRKPLNAVRCIAISPTGVLTVGDPATREVYRRNEKGEMQPTVNGLIGIPVDLAYSSNGTLYIADVERRVVWKQDDATSKPTIFAKVNPRGLFVDSKDRLWVVSQDEKQIIRLDPDGKEEVIVGDRQFEFPHQVVVDSQDRAWVTDGYKKALWLISPGEAPRIAFSGEPLMNPVGLFLYEDTPAIVDPHAQQVFRLRDGKLEPWIRIEPK